jgi:hypothetical protein
MPITYKCQCGKTLHVKDKYAGKRSKCPACGRPFQFPALSDSVGSAIRKISLDLEEAPAAQADQPNASAPVSGSTPNALRLRLLQTFVLVLAGIMFFVAGLLSIASKARQGDSPGWFLCGLVCWLIIAVNQMRWHAEDRR